MQLGDWIEETRTWLGKISELPGIETYVLAGEVLHQPKSWMISHPEAILTTNEISQLDDLRSRVLKGEPLPYVIGHWDFFGLDFLVTPSVLIPRPETELLVEQALKGLEQQNDAGWIADVGTGSGCIAVSLAKHHKNAQIIATDRSWQALKIAAVNANRHGVDSNITLIQTDLLQPFRNCFDLVCANLPYIPTAQLGGLSVSQHEPLSALDGGTDGLFWIKNLLKLSHQVIRPRGRILLEIESDQGNSAINWINELLPFTEAVLLKDLAGKDRLISIQF